MRDIIITTAPISIEDLKKYFVSKDITYIIDYENSQLKSKKLLTYLSNLDIPSDIKIDIDGDDFRELLLEYMNSHFLVKSETLERFALKVLMTRKKIIEDKWCDVFIEKHKDVVDHWINIVDSLLLYNMYVISIEEFQSHAKSFENDNTIQGINFVNLLKYSEFYSLFEDIDKDKLKFYSKLFEEYVYKGKSLFDFWCNPENHLFLATWGIAEGIVEAEELVKVVHNDLEFFRQKNILF